MENYLFVRDWIYKRDNGLPAKETASFIHNKPGKLDCYVWLEASLIAISSDNPGSKTITSVAIGFEWPGLD